MRARQQPIRGYGDSHQFLPWMRDQAKNLSALTVPGGAAGSGSGQHGAHRPATVRRPVGLCGSAQPRKVRHGPRMAKTWPGSWTLQNSSWPLGENDGPVISL